MLVLLVLPGSDCFPFVRCLVAGLYLLSRHIHVSRRSLGNYFKIEILLVNASYIDLVCPESKFSYSHHSLGRQAIAETLVKKSESLDFGCESGCVRVPYV